jgi:hypothetical protein
MGGIMGSYTKRIGAWAFTALVSFTIGSNVYAATHALVDSSAVVEPMSLTNQHMVVHDLVLGESGNFSLKIEETSQQNPAVHVSALLVSDAHTVLRSQDGVVSPSITLAAGTYKLYMHYTLPADLPWLTLEASVYNGGTIYDKVVSNVTNPTLPEGKRVVRIPLDRESFSLAAGNRASLHVSDFSDELSDIALSSLEVQVVDSHGLQVAMTGEGDSTFTFSEDATMLVYAEFADEQDEAILDIKIADRSVEGDGLVVVDRVAPGVDVNSDSTGQFKVAITPGKPVNVTLRGVDLGAETDDVSVLLTTLSAANTFKYETADLLDKTAIRRITADNETLYIASVVNSGDMAVIVKVSDETGKTLLEKVVTGDRLINLGSFTNPTPQDLNVTLTDFNFPLGFDTLAVAALSGNLAQSIPVIKTSSTQRQTLRTINLISGTYHMVALADLDNDASATLSLSVRRGEETLFETVNTLGANSIAAVPFSLNKTADVTIRLTDLEFPQGIDDSSVALFSGTGLVASGTGLIEKELVSGRYYVAVSARSDDYGVYHLSAQAVDKVEDPDTDGGEEPPRNVDGNGGGGGGGSLNWGLLISLFGLLALVGMKHRHLYPRM